jgi:small GTP-binding protein
LFLGVECFKKIHKIKNTSYLIKIWDTCGQERFKSLTTNYYRNADGVILVFDVSEDDSFNNLKKWLNSLNENTSIFIPKVVVANKIDLNRTVQNHNIKQFQKENKVEVFECSAKVGTNIQEAFNYIIKHVTTMKDKKYSITLDNSLNENKCYC